MHLPPGHPDAPKFWRWHSTSELRKAIENLSYGAVLSEQDITLLRAYLKQFIDSPVWDNPEEKELQALRETVDHLNSAEGIRAWVRKAVKIEIDPL